MRLRTPAVSPAERVASLATATAVTLGTALVVLAALAPSFVRVSGSTTTRDAEHRSERVVYVTPPAAVPVVAPTRQAATSSVRRESRGGTMTAGGQPIPALRADSASSAPELIAPARNTRESTSASRPAVAGSVAAAVVGFTRGSAPFRADSAARAVSESLAVGLKTGRLDAAPTQEERDAKLRAESFEIADAHGKGEPVRQTMAGGGIAVPLPFGGPSRKQRERDRALGAELMVMRAVRQARIDSIVAARQRRRTDSLARIADSMRAGARPRP